MERVLAARRGVLLEETKPGRVVEELGNPLELSDADDETGADEEADETMEASDDDADEAVVEGASVCAATPGLVASVVDLFLFIPTPTRGSCISGNCEEKHKEGGDGPIPTPRATPTMTTSPMKVKIQAGVQNRLRFLSDEKSSASYALCTIRHQHPARDMSDGDRGRDGPLVLDLAEVVRGGQGARRGGMARVVLVRFLRGGVGALGEAGPSLSAVVRDPIIVQPKASQFRPGKRQRRAAPDLRE